MAQGKVMVAAMVMLMVQKQAYLEQTHAQGQNQEVSHTANSFAGALAAVGNGVEGEVADSEHCAAEVETEDSDQDRVVVGVVVEAVGVVVDGEDMNVVDFAAGEADVVVGVVEAVVVAVVVGVVVEAAGVDQDQKVMWIAEAQKSFPADLDYYYQQQTQTNAVLVEEASGEKLRYCEKDDWQLLLSMLW